LGKVSTQEEAILMHSRASITVLRPRGEVERLWHDPELRPAHISSEDADVRFVDAPGDRGTEIHVEVRTSPPGGQLGRTVRKLAGREPLAKVKDDLRHFKQRVETGVIARSDASPEGELAERKLRERPGQPMSDAERAKVGV
jgi:uncharacterized membrane protein